MSIVPCQRNDKLKKLIEEYAEVLKKDAHNLGNHGLTEEEFYDSGLLGVPSRGSEDSFQPLWRTKENLFPQFWMI